MGDRDAAEGPAVGLWVRPSILADAALLAPRLRQADLDEIEAHSGSKPIDSLEHGIRMSHPCYTVVYKDQPAAVFGVVPLRGLWESVQDGGGFDGDFPRIDGAVWLLGSDDIQLFTRQFLRWSKYWMDKVTEDYTVVGNIVDQRNSKHLRWIAWLGFDFHDRIKHGPQDQWFRRFYKEIKTSV